MDCASTPTQQANDATEPSIADDPLSADHPDDVVIVTTRRGLARVALIAAETGARFERQGLAGDFMDWLLQPQPLFGSVAPIEACLQQMSCGRAILLHGLDLPLDATALELDTVIRERQ